MQIREMAAGLVVDFCFSFFVFSILQGTITHIFYLGRSKSAIKKLSKQYSLIERIRLCHVKDGKESCKHHKKALYVFLRLRSIYIGILCVTILVHLLSLTHVLTAQIWIQYLKIKWCSVDAAAFVYSFVMTKIDKKHGGCTLRWE